MGKLRQLSGKDVVAIFGEFGFVTQSTKGSHVKLRRINREMKETLVVPLHLPLKRGMLGAIYKQAIRFIPENELRNRFYTE